MSYGKYQEPFGDFVEPSTVSEAEERISSLRADLNKIEHQLRDIDRQSKMNWSKEEYSRWRNKAMNAKNIKSSQQFKLKRWLANYRAERALYSIKTKDPSALLAEMVDMIIDLRQKFHLPLSSEQQNILSLAEHVTNNMNVSE